MKNSTKGNIYAMTLLETQELFASYLSGAPGATVCILSEKAISSPAQEALESSMARLGYGRKGCTYAALHALTEEESRATDIPLDAQALFLLLEGLDPLVLVATDKQAATTLSEAYRQKITPDTTRRLFGRDLVAFASFENLLKTTEGKQTAWGLLKKLPKFGEH